MKRNKTGGRQKGVLNRTTSETKEVLKKIINKELSEIDTLLVKLAPKDRLDAIIKLLPYIMPKQSEILLENKESVFTPVIINLNAETESNDENND